MRIFSYRKIRFLCAFLEFMRYSKMRIQIGGWKRSYCEEVYHLQALLGHFNRYFPEETAPEQYDWIRSPLTVTRANHLTTELEDALLELSSDRTLKTAFNSKTLAEFWISVEKENPQLSKTTMDVLMPFGTTYL